VVTDPFTPVVTELANITVDGQAVGRPGWRAIVFHKPRGVVSTHSDPEGRTTIFDVLGERGVGLVSVGRLDAATTGLMLLTNDTRLADWIADPRRGVPRVYVVTVRGRLTAAELTRIREGVVHNRETLRASGITVRKESSRESHAVIELREGKNREVRRLFEAVGHEVTRLKRVSLGSLTLGRLEAGEWRELRPSEVRAAFPGAPLRTGQSR
jgi:23S rRNA pseudouridine2605 synthase